MEWKWHTISIWHIDIRQISLVTYSYKYNWTHPVGKHRANTYRYVHNDWDIQYNELIYEFVCNDRAHVHWVIVQLGLLANMNESYQGVVSDWLETTYACNTNMLLISYVFFSFCWTSFITFYYHNVLAYDCRDSSISLFYPCKESYYSAQLLISVCINGILSHKAGGWELRNRYYAIVCSMNIDRWDEEQTEPRDATNCVDTYIGTWESHIYFWDSYNLVINNVWAMRVQESWVTYSCC